MRRSCLVSFLLVLLTSCSTLGDRFKGGNGPSQRKMCQILKTTTEYQTFKDQFEFEARCRDGLTGRSFEMTVKLRHSVLDFESVVDHSKWQAITDAPPAKLYAAGYLPLGVAGESCRVSIDRSGRPNLGRAEFVFGIACD
jgi:hypothetical protein